MTHDPVTEIKAGLNFGGDTIPVGRLAVRDGIVYFEYDRSFLETGLEISPLRLPLEPGLQSFDRNLFEGLPGVFNDSLPDGWGRLLFDRSMRAQGILPEELTPLDRLAHVGHSGIGALVYQPDYTAHEDAARLELDRIAAQVQEVLDGTASDVLQELLALNGSSAGARPKALIGVDAARQNIVHGAAALPDGCTPWLVKFPNSTDGQDAGAIEYVYALMAKEAGIAMPETHLFPARNNNAGYFATQRFDRNGGKRLHVHTACGLLHSDFRTPSLDYEDLLALTGRLTGDIREVEKMFRLAVFNVMAHNRDDHAKNFSFLMNGNSEWSLSPAYDLTFSAGLNGEQSTMVAGEGKLPGLEHLRTVGASVKLDGKRIEDIIDRTRAALGRWEDHAAEYGISRDNAALIAGRILC